MKHLRRFAPAIWLTLLVAMVLPPAVLAHDCSDREDCGKIPPNVDIATGIAAAGAGAAIGWSLLRKKKKCVCELGAGAEDLPAELRVFAAMDDRIVVEWPYLAFGAAVERLKKIRITATQIEDGLQKGVTQEEVRIPVDGSTFEWELVSAKVVKSKTNLAAPDTELHGRNGEKGRKVTGARVVIPLDFNLLYEDWLVESGLPHFEGQLIDLEIKLACRAMTPAGTIEKSLAVTLRGNKAGDKSNEIDFFKVEMPADVRETKGQAAYEETTLASSAAGCAVKKDWENVAISLTAPSGPVKLHSGQLAVLGATATLEDNLKIAAGGNGSECKGDRRSLGSIFPRPRIEWSLEYLEGKNKGKTHRFSDGDVHPSPLSGDGPDVFFVPPAVDEDTECEVTCVLTDQFSPARAHASFRVTLLQYGDLVHYWYKNDRLLDKLVEAGRFAAGDKEKLKVHEPMQPGLWEITNCGLKITGAGLKAWRGFGSASERFAAVAKDPVYPFEVSAELPPQFAGIPKEEFARLHPLKRAIEPLVGASRLSEILPESTGPDYFYRGGSPAVFDEAWRAYFNCVRKRDFNSPWEVPDPKIVDQMTKNVRFHRLQQAAAVRVNELIKIKVAEETGRIYEPKIKVIGTPRIALEQFRSNPPELSLSWCEETKLGVQRFRITMQVEMEMVEEQLVKGLTVKRMTSRVQSTGKFINFVMELGEDQRTMLNERLARMGVSEAARYNPPPRPPRTISEGPTGSILDLSSHALARQSLKHWAINTSLTRLKSGGAWSAAIYFLANGFEQMVEGCRKEGAFGVIKGFGKGVFGAALAAGKSTLFSTALDFAQKWTHERLTTAAEAVEFAAARFETTIARRMAIQGAGEVELAAMRGLAASGRLSFVAARIGVRGALKFVPVIGWGLVLWDVAQMSDAASKSLGEWLFYPESDIEVAWKDPFRSIAQMDMGDHSVVLRGVQARKTNVINKEFQLSDVQRKMSPELAWILTQFEKIYECVLEPRATRIVLRDGTTLEIADEVVGPQSEFLPKLMRERLPELPSGDAFVGEGLPPYGIGSPYDLAQHPYELKWMKDIMEKTRWRQHEKLVGIETPIANAIALNRWCDWRDHYATKWFRLEHPQSLSSFLWWRDYTGREGRIITTPEGVILEPAIDMSAILKELGMSVQESAIVGPPRGGQGAGSSEKGPEQPSSR